MKPVCLVTGASRGIGRASALRLARDGFAVGVHYHQRADAAASVVEAVVAAGGEAAAFRGDMTCEVDIVRVFDTLDKQLGPLAALVNNAAILRPQMRIEAMDAERINAILTTNVTGAFICCREAVRRMSTAHGGQGGSIVNVSSAAARLGSAGEYVDYAASKGALDTLTRGLALEVAREGIRVNGVRPGFIFTEMHADGGEPGRVDRVAPTLPLGRCGTTEEVANAIAWLISDEASYATGTFIDVAGGR